MDIAHQTDGYCTHLGWILHTKRMDIAHIWMDSIPPITSMVSNITDYHFQNHAHWIGMGLLLGL
jgi:hypothetical protein